MSNGDENDWHLRAEQLYDESARTLAEMVATLEAERSELLELLKGRNERVNDLVAKIEQHQTRYGNAIRMITRRQEQLSLQRKAYQVLASQFSQLGEKHSKLVTEISELNKSVRDLHSVNTVDLDGAIDTLANAIDTALLR